MEKLLEKNTSELQEAYEIYELLKNIDQWFVDIGMETINPDKQFLKVVEEVGELGGALARSHKEEQINNIKDAIGDIVVTLIGESRAVGVDFVECINIAYDEIKDRKITVVDGVGIKSEDF